MINCVSLLSWIRREIESLGPYIETVKREIDTHNKEPSSAISLLANYNYITVLEIRDIEIHGLQLSGEEEQVIAMRDALRSYLEGYAPGQKNLARYVTAISLYLTFYALRPLHPPEMNADGFRIEKRGDLYYCTGKTQFVHEKGSLCRFCVCKAL
jgi:uncharacterized protein (UPF0305 family)